MKKNSSLYNTNDHKIKIKICGMGAVQNILEVASLKPDYLGFIFYENSPRNFQSQIPQLPEGIKKTGVFVDAPLDFILEKNAKYNFQALQLHGDETADFCNALRKKLKSTGAFSEVEIIKVFSIKEVFDFSLLKAFEEAVDYFLFDTKGKNKGGNGYTFNWEVLKNYPSKTPFFLSGGIGLEEIEMIRELTAFFQEQGKEDLLYAVDVNSRFETVPGKKDVKRLQKFSIGLSE